MARKAKRELTDVERAEELLAEALNEANRRGLKHLTGRHYDDPKKPTRCCAIGAIALAQGKKGHFADLKGFIGIVSGNDDNAAYFDEAGTTLGYAIGRSFRDALR